ncbi:MAG: hypothetical protein A2X23_07095 [Chloroflexi bacterium GWC2_73_18]|nr:MAG: hypothetical protein A2X23_07095 [Chloroflexi bacterium GWC2_73_18]
MPTESLAILVVAAVIVNAAVTVALLVSARTGRRPRPIRGRTVPAEVALAGVPAEETLPARALIGRAGSPPGVTTATYDRVVRMVAYALLLVSALIVTMSGLWAGALTAIFALVAVGAVFMLVVHDLLPARLLGRARYGLEGLVAIGFVTALIGLTGGLDSPFFFGYYLVVAAAALIASDRATLAVALASVGAYLTTVAVMSGFALPTTAQTTSVAFNLVALSLLSYLTVVVVREQRLARDSAVRLSVEDSLTGLYTRGYCHAAIEREIQRAGRSGRDFCLLMMDLDDLKPINDTYGHHVGDGVLRGVAGVIAANIRRIDTAARYGGDEFVVLLPETDPTGAFVVAEKIRAGVAAISWPVDGTAISTSTSIGIVAHPGDGTTVDGLLKSADAAMYVSKRLGKDRVVTFADGRSPFAPAARLASRPDASVPASAEPWSRPTPMEPRPTPSAPLSAPTAGGSTPRRFPVVDHDEEASVRRTVESLLSGSSEDDREGAAAFGAAFGAADRTAPERPAAAGSPGASGPAFAPGLPGDPLTDLLTGLDSRQAWERALRDEAARSERYRRPVTVLSAELDGLQMLAQRFPSASDRLVHAVGDALRSHARGSDRVARVGPASFQVLMPETDEIQAINYVERVRDACDRWLEGGAVPLHLSIGWAAPGTGGDLDTALRTAEDRMYADRARASRTVARVGVPVGPTTTWRDAEAGDRTA